MKNYQQILHIKTKGKGLREITREVRDVVRDSKIISGLCNLFVRHTSASLIIQENVNPDVQRESGVFFRKAGPRNRFRIYSHSWGPGWYAVTYSKRVDKYFWADSSFRRWYAFRHMAGNFSLGAPHTRSFEECSCEYFRRLSYILQFFWSLVQRYENNNMLF